METETRRWKVTGTLRGKVIMVFIDARDRNEAVRIASGAGFMLCVRDCVLLAGQRIDTSTSVAKGNAE